MQKQADKTGVCFLPKEPNGLTEIDTHFQKIGFERYFSGLQADLYPKGSRFHRIKSLGFVSHFRLRPIITFHHISTLFTAQPAPEKFRVGPANHE